MMNEKIEDEKNNIDDFLLPGFRFHPTDEELVGFYLKRKLQQRSLPIELIKQVDIYKYDPWDLPKLASTGEKEWYFYCPRDQKYRNSTRPNRVTGSGFWKATGTDRPIYSSDGTRCIGLKKSLVFYRGRAAKGFKTDWMMHEFRLPSAADAGAPLPKKICSDKNIPATDSWAICRIFKKITSMANRVHSHSWNVSLSDQTTSPDHAFTYTQHHTQNLNVFSTSSNVGYFPENFVFSPTADNSGTTSKSTTDYTSMPFSPSSSPFIAKSSECLEFEGSQQHFNGLSTRTSLTQLMHEDDQEHLRKNTSATNIHINPLRSMGFPFSLPPADSWKPNNLPWDSPAPCPSEISSGAYSTNKCYT